MRIQGHKTILKCGHILSPSGSVKASSASAWSSTKPSGSLLRVESGSGTALQQALNQRSHREGAFPCLFTGIYLELGFEREMLSRSLAVSCSSPSPNPSLCYSKAVWKLNIRQTRNILGTTFCLKKKKQRQKKMAPKKGLFGGEISLKQRFLTLYVPRIAI